MTKHTLGPWFSQYDDNGFYEIAAESAGLRIAFTFGENDTDEANVRLIAAAPDLLNALEQLVAVKDYSDLIWGATFDWDAARAAIAKARGKV